MSCYLLIKNLPSKVATGVVIGVYPESHTFGRLESKAEFIAQGGVPEDFPRYFVIVKVTDLEPDAPELTPLFSIDAVTPAPYRLVSQSEGSPYYEPLAVNAYVEAPWAVINSIIEENI